MFVILTNYYLPLSQALAKSTNLEQLLKIEVLESELFDGSIAHQAGDFKKWMKLNHPDVEVIVPNNKPKFDLHDYSLVMPLVNLATNMSLVNYLGLVVAYADYCFRGKLDGESNEVQINVIYEDTELGKKKEFNFKGSKEALESSIEKFNLNEFMDDV